MTDAARTGTVQRQVYFYLATISRPDEEELLVNGADVCAAIDRLRPGESNWYMDIGDGNVFCAWNQTTLGQPRLRIGLVRRSALPSLEHAGQVLDLPVLQDQGVAELAHVVFFPNGVVGVEHNHHGPRISRLPAYLNDKAGVTGLHFEQLVRKDIMEALSNMREIRALTVRFRRQGSALLRASSVDCGGSLNDALEAANEELGANSIELIWRRPRRGHLGKRVIDLAKDVFKSPELGESVEKFKIEGRTDRSEGVETLDLLQDRLMSKRQVVRQHAARRAIDPDSMYEEINKAYNELAHQLAEAVRVG